MKKFLQYFIALIIVVGLGYIFYRASQGDKALNVIRVGYGAESVVSAPIIIAYEKGYFKDHGIDVNLLPLKGGKEVVQAMTANQVDIGVGSLTNFMIPMSKNAPMRFIASVASSPSFVFVRPNENLNKFTDLYGKTISIGTYGINDLIFRTVMGKENVDSQKMKFVDIDRSYFISALFDKKIIDAAVVADQDAEVFYKAGAIILPEWQAKGYNKQAEPRSLLAVSSIFLNQNEDLVNDFLDAYIEAHRLISQKPDEAAAIVSKHIKEVSGGAIERSPEKIAEQWKNKTTEALIWQSPEITMAMARQAKELGAIDRELSLQEVFDLRFKEKLQEAQKNIYGKN